MDSDSPVPKTTRRPHCPIGIFLSVCCRSVFILRSGDPVAGDPPYSRFTRCRSSGHKTETTPAKLHNGHRHPSQAYLSAAQTPDRISFQKGTKSSQKEGEFLKTRPGGPKQPEKTGRTGTNAQQAGNQKYRAPVRQNTTRIWRETNEKNAPTFKSIGAFYYLSISYLMS